LELVSIRSFGVIRIACVKSASIWHESRLAAGTTWQCEQVELDPEGRALLGNNWLCAVTPTATIVVDPSTWRGARVEMKHGYLVPELPVDQALDYLGVAANDVTHVVITHGHADHYTGVLAEDAAAGLRFPRAEHFFPEADRRAFVTENREHRASALSALLGPIERADKLRLVAGDCRIADGVWILAAPGETPGHQVVRIETEAHDVYYLGDLVHFPGEATHPEWIAEASRDEPALIRSRRRLFAADIADHAVYVTSHGRFPPWGELVVGEHGARSWRYLQEPA
jgi:glyoxylase-like metal-dependent hydrolase (beta-lactamase superfamily II)